MESLRAPVRCPRCNGQPSWKEVRATTTVVVITVFIFGVYFFLIDNLIQKGVSFLFDYFKSH